MRDAIIKAALVDSFNNDVYEDETARVTALAYINHYCTYQCRYKKQYSYTLQECLNACKECVDT